MKGNNEFHLNKATMLEVIQEYFDRCFSGDVPKAQDIEPHSNDLFVIKTHNPENKD